MSKSVGKVLSYTPLGIAGNAIGKAFNKATGVSYDSTPDVNYMNYLQNYDTSKTDDTLANLQNYAYNQSQNLGNMQWNTPTVNADDWYIPTVNADQWNFPTVNKEDWNFPTVNESDWYMPEINKSDYNVPEVNKSDWTFNVNTSDEARRQAQEATYNSYMDYLNPQFERQTSDLESSLINKGLGVGSEAYERAMSDLQDRQNAATNQAAYQSVLAGQNAYSQDLQNQIAAGNFGNTAVNSYYNALLNANQGQNDYLNAQLAANQNRNALYNAQLNANSANTAYQNALLNANSALTDYNNANMSANDARVGLINAQNSVNNAQASYLAQILGALGESPSAYDIQGDIYAVGSNKAQNEYTAKQQTAANRLSLINSLLGAAGKAAGAAAGGA